MSLPRRSEESSAAATGTEREASFTQTTGPWYFGSTFTAVWALDVVAPPSSSGISNPWRCISEAKFTISSREGVIRPERPMRSASTSRAASMTFWAGTMTPRSMTS